MYNLNEQVKFFIIKKLKDDRRWKNLRIVFSGSDVPGEGEHKILEFIRNIQKDKESFNPNWTFMIYGAGKRINIYSKKTLI
jgi:5'-3' exoribonuclease 1